jgi:hypothetical protein
VRLKELETEAEALAGRKFNLGSNARWAVLALVVAQSKASPAAWCLPLVFPPACPPAPLSVHYFCLPALPGSPCRFADCCLTSWAFRSRPVPPLVTVCPPE